MNKQQNIGADSQEALVEAMLRPGFYSNSTDEVFHKETHISHVFLVGDLVYKIKKPVCYSFLDFSTLARRRHFLLEELRLNRRLAPSVYLDVVPLVVDDNGWRLGDGEPAEYALVMRRLPAERMLKSLLQTQQATATMMEELADHLANFHARAEAVRDVAPDDYIDALRGQWKDNVMELKALVANDKGRRALDAIESFGAEFLSANCNLLARRVADGWIRDVHGDLHAEHICFAPEGIQIFDCIEFSAEFRRCDLASEIAFLLMDAAVRGGEKLVGPFIRRYKERIGDADLMRLLPHFQCYRAMVRAKVHALREDRWNEQADRYLHYARRMTWEPLKPFLLLVSGLAGSGKSTVARPVAERLGMAMINSDVVRKEIAGKPGSQRAGFGRGIYSASMTEKTYAEMARRAEEKMLNREGVVIDATFGRRDHRDTFAALAGRYRIPLIVVHCSASEAVTEKRLSARAAGGEDVSDAGWDVYVEQRAEYQPIDEFSPSCLIELRTEAPVDQLVDQLDMELRVRLTA